MTKNKIIIAAPSYNPSIGGGLVLHKLCHVLNVIGYDAYLYPTLKLNGTLDFFYLNENYSTKIATEFTPEKDIIIYPEIEPGNPLEGKNVVRYILNKFHLPGYDNNIITWKDNDYWLYSHEHFYDKIKEPNYLHIIESKLDIYQDYGLERKINACFTYRKRTEEKNNLNITHPPDALEIGYNMQDQELINIFNSCKRFYSYDYETYLSQLAVLCGCESIIVPYKDIKKEDLIEKLPALKYGVAYGLDDLEYANSTKHLLKEHLQNLENQQYIDTKLTFEKIFKYFNL
jgi:hypothetical protein